MAKIKTISVFTLFATLVLFAFDASAQSGAVKKRRAPAKRTPSSSKVVRPAAKKARPAAAAASNAEPSASMEIIDLRAQEQAVRDERVRKSASSSRTWGWINTVSGALLTIGGTYMMVAQPECHYDYGSAGWDGGPDYVACEKKNERNLYIGAGIMTLGVVQLTLGGMQLFKAKASEDIHEGLKTRNESNFHFDVALSPSGSGARAVAVYRF